MIYFFIPFWQTLNDNHYEYYLLVFSILVLFRFFARKNYLINDLEIIPYFPSNVLTE